MDGEWRVWKEGVDGWMGGWLSGGGVVLFEAPVLKAKRTFRVSSEILHGLQKRQRGVPAARLAVLKAR